MLSVKCNFWLRIYNTVIYCKKNKKFLIKGNKSNLPFVMIQEIKSYIAECTIETSIRCSFSATVREIRSVLLMAHPSVESVLICHSCTCDCMHACMCRVAHRAVLRLRGQRSWQVCRFLVSAPTFSLWPLQDRPTPQSQRWKISRPWVPFLRWRVHTCPSVSTGLQMRDQKCRAQHRPSRQSEDRKHVSPSPPDREKWQWCQTGAVKTQNLIHDSKSFGITVGPQK